jgi:hypothetical protein
MKEGTLFEKPTRCRFALVVRYAEAGESWDRDPKIALRTGDRSLAPASQANRIPIACGGRVIAMCITLERQKLCDRLFARQRLRRGRQQDCK